MINDLKQTLSPQNLFLLASIEVPSHSLLAKAASWCYQPCQWALGRHVVVVRDNVNYAETRPPLLKIFERPWVQTLLRIAVYIPTLIGRCLQTIAIRNDETYKKTFYNNGNCVAFSHIESADLSKPTEREKLTKEIEEALLPTIELRELFAKTVMKNCLASKIKTTTAGFMMPYMEGLNISLWYKISEELKSEALNYDGLIALVKSLAADPVEGAANMELFFRPIYNRSNLSILISHYIPSGIEDYFLNLENTLINIGLDNLTDSQKQALAQRLAHHNRHGYYDHFTSSILVKLNFVGLDKLQTCERLLNGHQQEPNYSYDDSKLEDPFDDGKIAPLPDNNDRAAIIKACDPEMLKTLFARDLKFPADVYLIPSEHVKSVLETFDVIKIIKIFKASPSLEKFITLFHNVQNMPALWDNLPLTGALKIIFKTFNELRLRDVDESGKPNISGHITLSFLKSLSAEQRQCFLDSLCEAYFDSMKKYAREIGVHGDAKTLPPDLLKIENLAKLYQYKQDTLDWNSKREKIKELVLGADIPEPAPDLMLEELENLYFSIPLRYYDELNLFMNGDGRD